MTGREMGGPSSSLGAGVLHNQGADHNAFGYRGFTADGRELRCSSVYFRNSAGPHHRRPLHQLRRQHDPAPAVPPPGLLPAAASDSPEQPNEFFGRDLVAVMDAMVTEAIREVGKPVDQMSRNDQIAILTKLDSSACCR